MLAYPETYYQAVALGASPALFTGDRRAIARAVFTVGERRDHVGVDTVLAELSRCSGEPKLIALLEDLGSPLNGVRKNVEWHVRELD